VQSIALVLPLGEGTGASWHYSLAYLRMKKFVIGVLGIIMGVGASIPFISTAQTYPQPTCQLTITPQTPLILNHPSVVTVSWNMQNANAIFFFGNGEAYDPKFTSTGSVQYTIKESTIFHAVARGAVVNSGFQSFICEKFIMADFPHQVK
jgi:hypothetical protein